MSEGTFGAKFAIPLAVLVVIRGTREETCRYLHEVLARCLLCLGFQDMREGAGVARLASTLPKELAGNVFGIW